MQKSEQAVLVVDDDEGICGTLEDFLVDEHGYSIEIAHCFKDAIDKVSTQQFSYVIIDLKLSEKENFEGINFFSYVRDHFCSIRKVVLSSCTVEEVKQKVRKSYPNLEQEVIERFVQKDHRQKDMIGVMGQKILEKFNSPERFNAVHDTTEKWWGNYHALLIAVQNYDEWGSNLTYPKQDAEKLAEILTTHYLFEPQNVQRLFDPSRQEIIRKLDELSRKLTEDDNLLIFYAGHGYKDKKNGRGYWMPRDACENTPEAWLSHRDVRHWVARIHTKHTLLISDSCFSGDIAKRADRADKEITGDACQKVYNHFSKIVISSGNQYERVDDKSVFLDEMSKCLKNSSEHLSAYAVYKKTKFQITGKSDQQPDYNELPESGKHEDEGDFIFIRR
jgi:CheY-like chemotaxis protein